VRAVRVIKPVGIYSFLDVANLAAFVISWAVGRPSLVWSVRAAGVEMTEYDRPTRLAAWLESRLSGGADLVIANSRAGQAWAQDRGFRVHRIEVVENGTDTVGFSPQPEAGAALRLAWGVADGEVLIGLVARLDPMKDHENFLRACAILSRKSAAWRFVCVGTGVASRRRSLEHLGRQLGLGSRLIWAGVHQDVGAVYSALDLACSSSAHGEGFSNVLAEAMACGVPCVATDVGDSARLLGHLGQVVPPRDAESLAQGIQDLHARLIREPGLKDLVRQHICAHYSLETMVSRTATLMDALTS
jgi:glycosyltransferase involved in cell wall biosynthesis